MLYYIPHIIIRYTHYVKYDYEYLYINFKLHNIRTLFIYGKYVTLVQITKFLFESLIIYITHIIMFYVHIYTYIYIYLYKYVKYISIK